MIPAEAGRPSLADTAGTGARPAAKPHLAVVGATGAVGRVLLGILSERADVWGEIRLIAAPRSAGRKLTVRGAEVEVLAASEEVFDGIDVAMFAVPDEVAARWVPVAVSKGAVAVDNSGAFRADPDVPLVVPEVNACAARIRPRGIVANPACTTLSMIVALGALHAEYGLSELVVSSYQAASEAGQAGTDTLRAQLSAVSGTELGTAPGDVRRAVGDTLGPFPAPLALNVVPWAGAPAADGWSSAELTIREESRKVLGLPELPVTATCVRVPVLTAHSMAVHARFENEVTVAGVHELLAAAPGVVLFDDPAEDAYPTPSDVAGTDPTWVGRVRRSLDDPRALELFVCGDNLRKGAALNLAQIGELVAGELRGAEE
ncbi:aspartate-semialdehyde dehydrogenase [Streptomyces sp. BHT-5-2]|uniref:aspartate-semialdehyde dehydrogenase n=1 Tax=unclassified Streptomyces TaxID=2593676 RepID=UPI001C8E7601|nr:aspartate-semialdehyde dehydrogenase [Streptomyces sp. BHT-5-2]QZL03119.1 aspartate-semialdehyde dehydrogenase [Streptomyces sp. BHT-5-2]